MFRFIFGLLIWLLLTIVLFLPLGILTIYKLLVIAVAKCRGGRNENWYPLPPSDSMFAPHSSWIKPVVNFGAVLKLNERSEGGFFSVEELRERFHDIFLRDDIEGGKYDKLSSYLERFGGIVFRVHKKEIDLKDHIYELNYDESKGKKQDIQQFLVEWLLSGYEERKPCWEMILVKLHSSMEMLLAFKIHHSLADGYTLLHIIDKLTGNSSPYLVRNFDHGTITGIKKVIEAPTNMGTIKPPRDSPFNVVLSQEKRNEWMMSFTSFPLDELKQFRRKHDVHMSAVIITIIIGAQRKFLEKEKEIKIPAEIGIAATIGWPQHPTRNTSISNRDKMCNHWATAMGKASFFEEDRIAILKEVDKSLHEFEDRGLHLFFKHAMLPITWTIPSSVLESMQPTSGLFGAGVTAIIGGDNYSLLGCKVDSIHPFFAFHDLSPYMPFSCFTFSHSGKLEVTFGVHPSLYQDQETLDRVLHQYMHEEFHALMKC